MKIRGKTFATSVFKIETDVPPSSRRLFTCRCSKVASLVSENFLSSVTRKQRTVEVEDERDIEIIQKQPPEHLPFLPKPPIHAIDIKLRRILRLRYSFVLIFRHPHKCSLGDNTKEDNAFIPSPPPPSTKLFANLQLVYICITTRKNLDNATRRKHKNQIM